MTGQIEVHLVAHIEGDLIVLEQDGVLIAVADADNEVPEQPHA